MRLKALPLADCCVWSAVGPVFLVGELPIFHVQSKPRFPVSWVYPHRLEVSKLHVTVPFRPGILPVEGCRKIKCKLKSIF